MSFYFFKRVTAIISLCFFIIMMCSCTSSQENYVKIKDLEFTVVEESMLPEDLKTMIESKKIEPFTATFTQDGYIYITAGYGTKQSGGYSIIVRELYQSNEGICFLAELMGPGKNEAVIQTETHPYIVVKTEDIGLNVIFQ